MSDAGSLFFNGRVIDIADSDSSFIIFRNIIPVTVVFKNQSLIFGNFKIRLIFVESYTTGIVIVALPIICLVKDNLGEFQSDVVCICVAGTL